MFRDFFHRGELREAILTKPLLGPVSSEDTLNTDQPLQLFKKPEVTDAVPVTSKAVDVLSANHVVLNVMGNSALAWQSTTDAVPLNF